MKKWGGSNIAEHGNWPIFLTEFGNFGGFRKTGLLSDMKMLYFEGRNTPKFQSYGHLYCLNRSVTLCKEVNDNLVPKFDH